MMRAVSEKAGNGRGAGGRCQTWAEQQEAQHTQTTGEGELCSWPALG